MRVPDSNRARHRRQQAKACVFLAASCALNGNVWAISGNWAAATSDTWLDSAAWTGGLPINAGDSAGIFVAGSPFTITLGQSLNLSNGSVTMNSAAATLAIGSGSTLTANSFTLDTGAVTGIVDTDTLELFTANPASTGTFLMDRPAPTVYTTSASAGSLIEFSPSPTVATVAGLFGNPTVASNILLTSTRGSANTITLTVPSSGLTSSGTITVNADPNDTLASDNVRTVSGSLVIAASGTLQINTSTTITARTSNLGITNVSVGSTLSSSSFDQYGSLILNGQMSAPNFEFYGGTITGSGTINTTTLTFENANGSSGTFVFDHLNCTISNFGNATSVPAGVTLMVRPDASTPVSNGAHSVTLPLTTNNNGTIDMTSSAGAANSVTLSSGNNGISCTNTGTINVTPDPNYSGIANNARSLTAPVVNQGSVNISSGVNLTVGTFNQAGGTLTLNGGLSGGPFTLAGGTVTGSGIFNPQYLTILPTANNSAGGITAVLDSTFGGASLTGSVPSGMTVLIQADSTNSGTVSSSLNAIFNGIVSVAPVNYGTMRLTSTYGNTNSVTITTSATFTNQGLLSCDPDPSTGVTNTRIIDAGQIINNPAGTVTINCNTQFGPSYAGNVINYGTFNVASGAVASMPSFNLVSGTLNLAGILGTPQLTLKSGTITGPGNIYATNLSIAPTFSGGGNIFLNAPGTNLNGPSGWNLPAGTTVNEFAGLGLNSITANTNNPFTNNGTIRLSSAAGTTNTITLNLTGTLTNNGLFSVDPDSSATAAQTNRIINGTIVNTALGTLAFNGSNGGSTLNQSFYINNNGTVSIASGATANVGTFNQTGGSLTVNGSLLTGTFNYSGGTVSGSANIDPTSLILCPTIPSGNSFSNGFETPTSGTLPAGVNLIYTANSVNYVGTPASTLANNGRIDLSRNGTSGTATLPVTTLTNAGLLVVDSGASFGSESLNYTAITNTITGSIQISSGCFVSSLNNSGSTLVGSGAQVSFTGFTPFIQQAGNLDIEGTLNINQMNFNGGTITGAGTLALSSGSGPLTVGAGEQAIGTLVTVALSATITTNGDLTLNNTLSINPGKILKKNGAGTLSIAGTQSPGAGASLNVSAGTVMIETDPGANLNLLANSSTVHLTAANTGAIVARNLASLNIGSGGLVSIDAPNSNDQRMLLVTGGLTFNGSSGGWHGQLDLTGNDLLIHLGNLTNLTDQLRSGFNSGGTAGQGIISSTVAADTTHLSALGILQNDDGTGNPIYPSFDSTSSIASDVLIKSTYFGDATLDGQVDGSDYSRIDNGYLNTLTGWSNGDFNYDNVIDGSDYTLIDNAFNSQGAQLSASIAGLAAIATAQLAGTSSVPEPTTLCVLTITSACLLTRRRRFSDLATSKNIPANH